MIDFILNLWANKWLAFSLYWLPLAFCAYGYFIRTIHNYVKDRRIRVTPGKFYQPTDTAGSLIGRVFVTLFPFVNICAAVFDLGPEIFDRFFGWIKRVFNTPLVPDRAEYVERRKKENDSVSPST